MSPSEQSLSHLQQTIDYRFVDESLLQLALRHKSSGKPNNERLEFLGDAILGAIVAESLYRASDTEAEGNMTLTRAKLVNGHALSELGRTLKLEKMLKLGRGERVSGDIKNSIIEDALEALIGAVFLDSDFNNTRRVVLKLFSAQLSALSSQANTKDAKTELQEIMQAKKLALPEYQLIKAEGPDHKRLFTVSCKVLLCPELTHGTSFSRRNAEQLAAEAMLNGLKKS